MPVPFDDSSRSRPRSPKLDHLLYAVPDLDAGIADIERRMGVRPTRGGQHRDYGTHNALLALGAESYLEIIAPDPGLPAPGVPRPFGIDALRAPKLVTWCVREPELEERFAYAREHGYDPGVIVSGGRERPDGVFVAWRLGVQDGLVAVGDGLVPFLINWGETPHPATSAPAGCTCVGLRATHPRPAGIRPKLDALGVELEVTEGDDAALIVTVDTPRGRVELS